MVVTRGKYRGLKLNTLSGENTRPTHGKAKEAIFSMLHHHVYDAYVLDLFAGSGALGIEALSNNARFVEFYDLSNDAIKIIKSNLEKIKEEHYLLEKLDYQKALKRIKDNKQQFDLIFLDPPYHLHLINEIISYIYDNDLLSADGIIVCESSLAEDIFAEYLTLEKYKEKKYGSSKISMFRRR